MDVFKFKATTAFWMSEYAASLRRQLPGVHCALSVAVWPFRVYKNRLNLTDCGIFQPDLGARDFRRLVVGGGDRSAKIGTGFHPTAKDEGLMCKEKQ
jgi:hypothetical protein